MKSGKLIGIGVGPGDTELLTIKADKTLKTVPVVCAPRSSSSKPSLALSIVQPVLDEREDGYEVMEPLFPMIEDKNELEGYWDHAADEMAERLDEGLDMAFITLGDPTVYSTFSYVSSRLKARGFEVEIIPGVTSFTGCAAASGIQLADKDEIIVIVPKVDERLTQILPHGDTFVIMKTSRHSDELERIISEDTRDKKVLSVQNCSMEDEKVFEGFAADNKYLSTTIVKFRDGKK